MEAASLRWWRVAESGRAIREGGRLHVCVEGRYITLFRNRGGALSAIDAICHHAGGPLTLGPIQDIEELGMTVVLCPWHRFMVSIDQGLKVYQGVDFVDGKAKAGGWKIGKIVQRPHLVQESEEGVFVSLNTSDEGSCVSDTDACNPRCAQDYPLHSLEPQPWSISVADSGP